MNVRSERIRMGLTLPELAAKVGVPYRTAWRAEQGQPIREGSAKRLADFFGCEPIVFVEPAAPDEPLAA